MARGDRIGRGDSCQIFFCTLVIPLARRTAIMNNYIRKVNIDIATLCLIGITSSTVLIEAATRSNLRDAQGAKECRYPPLASIITKG